MSMLDILWYGEFKGVKKEPVCLLEEVKAYDLESKNIEKELVERKVATKAMTRTSIDLKNTFSPLERERCMMMRAKKELLSCL